MHAEGLQIPGHSWQQPCLFRSSCDPMRTWVREREKKTLENLQMKRERKRASFCNEDQLLPNVSVPISTKTLVKNLPQLPRFRWANPDLISSKRCASFSGIKRVEMSLATTLEKQWVPRVCLLFFPHEISRPISSSTGIQLQYIPSSLPLDRRWDLAMKKKIPVVKWDSRDALRNDVTRFARNTKQGMTLRVPITFFSLPERYT